MSKKANIQDLQREYEKIAPIYSKLCFELEKEVKEIIASENIKVAIPIEFRTKTFDSISDKISNEIITIKKSVTELQDIAGLRIVTLFKSDVEKLINIIKLKYDIIREYNTGERLEEMEFGYLSIHIICKLKNKSAIVNSDFENKKFEIQVRTLSQHTWAEASNIFQYKQEADTPKQLKRSVNRISALLEIVDFEFERLLKERELYIKSKVDKNEKLNVDLLEKILDDYFPHNKYSRQNLSSLLKELFAYRIKNITDLKTLIEKHIKVVTKSDQISVRAIVKNIDLNNSLVFNNEKIRMIKNGYFYSQVGLIRSIINLDRKS